MLTQGWEQLLFPPARVKNVIIHRLSGRVLRSGGILALDKMMLKEKSLKASLPQKTKSNRERRMKQKASRRNK